MTTACDEYVASNIYETICARKNGEVIDSNVIPNGNIFGAIDSAIGGSSDIGADGFKAKTSEILFRQVLAFQHSNS